MSREGTAYDASLILWWGQKCEKQRKRKTKKNYSLFLI
jgi:hypothetical protein